MSHLGYVRYGSSIGAAIRDSTQQKALGGGLPIHHIVEAFQRAAIGIGSWRDALALLTAQSGGHVGQIIGVDRNKAMIVNFVTGASDEQIEEYITTGGPDPQINPRTRAVLHAPPLQVIAEGDFGTYDALRSHPYYQGFFARNEVPYSALAKLGEDGGQSIVMALMRSESQGHLSDHQRRLIEACAPIVKDAVMAGLLLERRQMDFSTGTFGSADVAAFAVSASGIVLAQSGACDMLLADGAHLVLRSGQLMPAQPTQRSYFAEAVARTAKHLPPLVRRSTSLLLPSLHGTSNLLVEIMPLPVDSDGWLHTACCLVAVRRKSGRLTDLPTFLQQNYHLTASECSIVEHLIDGLTTTGIAGARGVSEGTVRNQIKAILAKTGFRRQVDLVRELSF